MEFLDYSANLEFAKQLDLEDPLKEFRHLFHIPRGPKGEETIYLCGNSLGLQPRSCELLVQEALTDWAKLGVEGHFKAKRPWFSYHEPLLKPMADVVGAKPNEVTLMNSLTTNLHLLMVSFYQPTAKRFKILIEKGAFPSDYYAMKSQIKFHGYDPQAGLLELAPRTGEHTLRKEDILKYLEEHGEEIALVLFGGVNYLTGQVFPMEEITKVAQGKGAKVGFDLAHAVGNVLLHLHTWGVDFAAWCSYKYLNSGPGGVGGCFVHEKHTKIKNLPRFAGWWGHNKKTRFEMGPDFDPIDSAEGWQLSNPPIFQLASLLASLELFEKVGMKTLREKSQKLTGFLEFLLKKLLPEEIKIITPSTIKERGAQISMLVQTKDGNHKDGGFVEFLSEQGIICDFRQPNIIRVAPAPLYNTFEDVFRFVTQLKESLHQK